MEDEHTDRQTARLSYYVYILKIAYVDYEL
jgi:hypothetical protein